MTRWLGCRLPLQARRSVRHASRLKVLAAQPKLALGALLTLLLAAGAVVGSGADFTASSANPSNTFASGTLTIANSKDGLAVLTASNLRPGEAAQTGTVDIENTGSLSGAFTLVRGAVSNTDTGNPLSAKLNMTVVDCGTFVGATPRPAATATTSPSTRGTLAAMTTSALGTYAAGAKHRYRFSVAARRHGRQRLPGRHLDRRIRLQRRVSRSRTATQNRHERRARRIGARRVGRCSPARRSPLRRWPRCSCSPLR